MYNGPGHMTKMAAMALNSKNLKNILQNQKVCDFETWLEASGREPVAKKLGMQLLRLEYSNMFINHDPVMTLTNFMAR